MRKAYLGQTLIAGVMLVACASAPTPPVARMEGSTAAIRAAEEVGAPRVPQAALYLQLAREQSERARDLLSQGERDRASSLLLRAEADAELAVALARENTMRSEAQQAMDRVRALRQSGQ